MTCVENRLWKRTSKQPGGCWLWLGCRNEDGYGQIKVDGRVVRTHRVAWEVTNGPVPPGLSVLHTCDVPACVNPAHLFLGTQLDNVLDARQKGRAYQLPPRVGVDNHGEKNPRAKLTLTRVRFIRAHPEYPTANLARALGVSKGTIHDVRLGRSWTDPAAS